MIGFNGGLIGKKREVWGDQIIPGVWTLPEQQIAISQNYWIGSRDRFFSNVSLLLHGNGTNGSTVFTDSSTNNFTVTRNGSPVISTAQFKYGGASMLFSATGDYLTLSENSAFNFGTGDYTVEAWIYLTGNAALNNNSVRHATIFSVATPGNDIFNLQSGFHMQISGNSTTTGIGVRVAKVEGLGTVTERNVTYTINKSQWYHVAVSKSGSSLRLFVDGTQIGSTFTDTTNWGSSSQTPKVSRVWNTSYIDNFPGHIDDLRVTKGIARYTSNFIPLRFQFPDSA